MKAVPQHSFTHCHIQTHSEMCFIQVSVKKVPFLEMTSLWLQPSYVPQWQVLLILLCLEGYGEPELEEMEMSSQHRIMQVSHGIAQ